MDTLLNVLFLPSLFLLLLLLVSQLTTAETSFYQLNNNSTDSARNLIAIKGRCNIFQGKWVFDSSYSKYDSSSCPFIDLEFNCKSRPDKLYQNYRWQPFDCNLPRYPSFPFSQMFHTTPIFSSYYSYRSNYCLSTYF